MIVDIYIPPRHAKHDLQVKKAVESQDISKRRSRERIAKNLARHLVISPVSPAIFLSNSLPMLSLQIPAPRPLVACSIVPCKQILNRYWYLYYMLPWLHTAHASIYGRGKERQKPSLQPYMNKYITMFLSLHSPRPAHANSLDSPRRGPGQHT